MKFSDGMGTTGGGEFRADVSDNGFGSTDYVTFCLEYRENLEMGKIYEYEISQAAMYNGNGTVDPILNGDRLALHPIRQRHVRWNQRVGDGPRGFAQSRNNEDRKPPAKSDLVSGR
ncbi:MAG: hypothetical protein IPK15_15005 [Verrucomicrobia bacterium]|nr:hypothetical protein [Verrucomicrobiota bacterium]